MARSWQRLRLIFAAIAITAGAWHASAADDSYARNVARLQEMSQDQKDDLRRKKIRFDGLGPDDQQKLRDMHASITSDANAKELMETVKSYNRWLATLDATERSALLDIKDQQERITRIKELIQQQEKRRFDQYFANLPDDDRKAIFQWIGEFVANNADAVREKLPPPIRQRIDGAADDEARKREMFGSWLRWRREFNLPFPADEDYPELLTRFSPETKKIIDSSVANELAKEPEDKRTADRQQALVQQKVGELVRTALYSRIFPQVSQDELMKYYETLKGDRRKQLDGKEGEELRRELQRMYNWDHGVGRGGPPGGPGGPGGRGGFGPGRGGPPPGPGSRPPPPPPK